MLYRKIRHFIVSHLASDSDKIIIADKEDLEVANLPTVLDRRISSYRVFQWYDAQKKGLASDTREHENSLITSSWCYSWGG